MSDNKFEMHSKIWDENAKSNAQWAVLSNPDKLQSGFNQMEFLDSGLKDVESVISKIESKSLSIDFKGTALDFGCGVGRLSAALARFFEQVLGVDVSDEMIRQARSLTSFQKNIDFLTNRDPDLRLVKDSSMSFILSLIVIQHIPPPFSKAYLAEFGRILRPGGILVVQIPTVRKKSFRNQIRILVPEFVFRLKHRLVKSNVPYVTMFGIPENEVQAIFEKSKLSKIFIEDNSMAGEDWESRTYCFQKQ